MKTDYPPRLIAGPAEPLFSDLVSVKSHLNISQDDTSQDDYLAQIVESARDHVERLIGKPIGIQRYEIGLRCWPWDGVLDFPRPPLVDVISIKYMDSDDTQHVFADSEASPIISDSTYFLETGMEPGQLYLKSTETWPSDTLRNGYPIKIQYTAGIEYGGSPSIDLSGSLRKLIEYFIANMYANRETVVIGDSLNVALLPDDMKQHIAANSYSEYR